MATAVRINKFDNIKGLAIFLIVFEHLIYLTKDLGTLVLLHDFTYILHLPLFFFVAGYFSKIGPDEPIKAFKRLLIPFIIFCIIYELFSIFVLGNSPNKLLFFKPGYALWFLISLFTMKLILPIFDRLKYPVLISFILALLIGFFDLNMMLGISRTFVFLPVFLIGFYYKDYKDRFNEKYGITFFEKKWVIWTLLILTIICCLIVAYKVPFDSISLKYQYSAFNFENIIIRAVIIILGIVHALIINKLMVNSNNILTKFGKNSLSVYLLHGYIVLLIKPLMKPYFIHHEKLFIIVILIISFVIVYILSRDFITKAVNKLTDSAFNLIAEF